jgi:TM2 domain-containing membrane protein YozV
MNKSVKVALLSAFVFPGVGHFYLKKHLVGSLLAGAAFAAIYLVVSKALELAVQIADKIQSGEVQLDVAAITELLLRQPTGAEAQLLNVASSVFIICWLIGMIDSYRVGRV